MKAGFLSGRSKCGVKLREAACVGLVGFSGDGREDGGGVDDWDGDRRKGWGEGGVKVRVKVWG